MTDSLEEFMPRCKVCWLPVVEVVEAAKVWGKGETAPFKHKMIRDADGNKACSKVALKEEDIEYVAREDS